MKTNVFLRNKGLNCDFVINGSDFKGTLLELLNDYKEELDKQLSIHDVMRSFLCRHNVPGFYIKEGKIYKPLGVTENHITITNDLGYTETYHKDWFIEIN